MTLCLKVWIQRWAVMWEMWLYRSLLPVWPVWLPNPPPLLQYCSSCRCWLRVSLMCVGVCGTLKEGQDGSFTHVSLRLPIWKRWCRSEWTPLASPVETHLRGSARWSVTRVNKHTYSARVNVREHAWWKNPRQQLPPHHTRTPSNTLKYTTDTLLWV